MANPVNFNSSVNPTPTDTGGDQSNIQGIESEISSLQARLQELSGASDTKHVAPSPTTILPPNPSPKPPFPFPDDIWIQIILRRIMELIRMLLEILLRRRFGDDPPPPVPIILDDKAPGSKEPPTTLPIQPLSDKTSPVE